MKVYKIVIYLMLVGLVLPGCGPMSVEDYVAWVKDYDNGLHQQRAVGEYVFDTQFKPIAYMMLKQNQGKLPTAQALEEYKTEAEGEVYFDLKLGPKSGNVDLLRFNAASQDEYQQRVYYFSFKFQESIYLEQDGKKIPCSAYHFERAYNLKNNRSFLLGFSNVDIAKPASLVIDSDLLKTGPVKFNFDWKELPSLRVE